MKENDSIEDKKITEELGELPEEDDEHHKASFLALSLGALGVVFGDIGTSPLYTIKECFHGLHAISLNEINILGVLSLVFWSLTMVVTLKYLTFVMQADNHGEGGIFSLLALVPNDINKISGKTKSVVILAALIGACLLYGDGIITPTISVLSAIEGLEVATETAKPFTIPITCIILFFLFKFQKKGTDSIGKIFGPVMITWFITISALGLFHIFKNPHVLLAFNPYYAYKFVHVNGMHAFVVLGSVVLCITGGEALYADMGHFGRKPIQLSWFTFVFPALLLNYFGQGSLLLSNPEAAHNPFYGLVPKVLIYPMVILATMATVIASQALISGAFSLTRQAIQMGFLPRLKIIHTSKETEGQIYIPIINKIMMITCIAIVLIFKESSRLASAYGLAVTANMVLTSIVFYFVITKTWNWSKFKAVPLIIFFLIFDILYFGSNMLKFFDGGWFPFTIAILILTVMLTWRDGRSVLGKRIRESRVARVVGTGNLSALSVQNIHDNPQINETNLNEVPIDILLGEMIPRDIDRVSGTAVFMSVSLKGIPPVMLHYLKHIKILHEQVILLSIKSVDVPVVKKDKIEVTEVGYGFYQIKAMYGFMETPNVPDIINMANEYGLKTDPEDITYFLGRETLLITNNSSMMSWRKEIFAFISKIAQPATAYFSIPADRVVELGIQIEL